MDDATFQEAWNLLEQSTVQTSSSSLTHQATSSKNYGELKKYSNVTSYSQLETLHRCPRKYQRDCEQAAFNPAEEGYAKVDFAFGHAVGAGVQNYLSSKSLDQAWLNAMLAWNADWEAAIPKKRKSLWSALVAVQKFIPVLEDSLDEWELLILPSGKPAIEVSISLHCGNGYKHYLHLDIAMRNKITKRVAVWDVKTTGFSEAEEALYANSSQALSYSVALEAALQTEVIDYDVYYLVYSSTDREWTLLPFTKSALDSAEFVKDLVITQDLLTTYEDLRFYPKRGASCYDFFRRCEYYGECNITADERLPVLAAGDEAETVDYVVQLQAVVDSLKAKKERLAKK